MVLMEGREMIKRIIEKHLQKEVKDCLVSSWIQGEKTISHSAHFL
jgi:hypothetical protein